MASTKGRLATRRTTASSRHRTTSVRLASPLRQADAVLRVDACGMLLTTWSVELRTPALRLARPLGEAIRRTASALAFLCCIAIVSACSRAPDAPLLPTYRGETGGNLPALKGKIVVNDEGCIALQSRSSSGSLPLLLPEGYSIERTEDDTWQIVGGPDASILPVGSTIVVSVRQISGSEAQRLSPGEPGSQCLHGDTLLVTAPPVADQNAP